MRQLAAHEESEAEQHEHGGHDCDPDEDPADHGEERGARRRPRVDDAETVAFGRPTRSSCISSRSLRRRRDCRGIKAAAGLLEVELHLRELRLHRERGRHVVACWSSSRSWASTARSWRIGLQVDELLRDVLAALFEGLDLAEPGSRDALRRSAPPGTRTSEPSTIRLPLPCEANDWTTKPPKESATACASADVVVKLPCANPSPSLAVLTICWPHLRRRRDLGGAVVRSSRRLPGPPRPLLPARLPTGGRARPRLPRRRSRAETASATPVDDQRQPFDRCLLGDACFDGGRAAKVPGRGRLPLLHRRTCASPRPTPRASPTTRTTCLVRGRARRLPRRLPGGYRGLLEQGVEALTIEANVRYLAPARFDDELRIHPRVTDIARRALPLRVRGRARTTQARRRRVDRHACVDAATCGRRACPPGSPRGPPGPKRSRASRRVGRRRRPGRRRRRSSSPRVAGLSLLRLGRGFVP